jgi:hypothetical protein
MRLIQDQQIKFTRKDRLRQMRLLNDSGPRFDLPDYLQLLAQRVILHRGEQHKLARREPSHSSVALERLGSLFPTGCATRETQVKKKAKEIYRDGDELVSALDEER